MRVAIATFGCKVNQYESRALEEVLRQRGHRIVPLAEVPDAVVVNSCTVTHRSDRDVRAAVRRARKLAPAARVLVCGCYAQVDAEALTALGVEVIVGTRGKRDIPTLLEQGAAGLHLAPLDAAGPLEAEPVHRFGERSRAYLKVQDGCEAFCAYCIVPYARGPSRSLPAAEVTAGLDRIRQAGYLEVVLTGVHLGRWGADLTPSQPFSVLLDLAERCGIPRVRLSSLEPKEVTPAVIHRLAASSVLCPHLHVPLQSGSDTILAAMGRPYRAAEFEEGMRAVAARVPGVCLGCDVMVGFPGETEADFAATAALLERLPVSYLHVFPFSPRRGTAAYALQPRVDPAVIKRRAAALRELSRAKCSQFWASQVGRTLPALIEGGEGAGAEGEAYRRLRTRNYVPVRVAGVQGEESGEIWVRIEATDTDGARGRQVPPPS